LSAYLEITAIELHRKYGIPQDARPLGAQLAAKHLLARHDQAGQAQINAWVRSLPELAGELVAAGLPEVKMFIEFRMPPSAMCADVILAGPVRHDGSPTYTLVELKQWSNVGLKGDRVLVGHRESEHPVTQIRQYMAYLEDVYAVLDNLPFSGIAFLHNATDMDMRTLRRLVEPTDPRMFGHSERNELQSWLRNRYRPGSSDKAAELLSDCRAAPTQKFMARVSAMLHGRDRFVLLDEQHHAYRRVIEAVEAADRSGRRTAVIVTGHAGTGKTAIALSVLAKYFGTGRPAQYATWQQAFRRALEANTNLVEGDPEKVFFTPRTLDINDPARQNCMRVAICDEAHHLEPFTKLIAKTPHSDPQIEEILGLSQVTLFLLDENQAVRATSVGTADRIEEEVKKYGVVPVHVSLTEQFRVGGNAAYIQQVRQLLNIEGGEPKVLAPTEDFQSLVVEHPEEIEMTLTRMAPKPESARITAGFCWEWPNDTIGNVVVGSWEMPWNLKRGKRKHGRPPSIVWAWERGGRQQIGCVHTAQGFEWDWAGVILGPDLVYEDGEVQVRPTANKEYPRRLKAPGAAFSPGELIRNAYYVLLTRGLRGVVIYAVDNKLRRYLSTKMPRAMVSHAGMTLQEWSMQRVKPHVRSAVDFVHSAGVPLPVPPIEYTPGHEALLAWREQRTAVLSDDLGSAKTASAIRAYEEAGWHVRTESNWDTESLKAALLDPPS
jgi:hypothetical protein